MVWGVAWSRGCMVRGGVPGGDPPRWLLLWAVRILLECILFGIIFADDCMKMKKNWTERGHTSLTPLDLPLIVTKCQIGPYLMSGEFHKDSLNSLRVTVVRKPV